MRADTALVAAINRLRQDRNAVILAHYYWEPEIQDIADFVGDSLELSRQAASTDADVVFCGVHFMAETARFSARKNGGAAGSGRLSLRMTAQQTTSPVSFESPRSFVVSYINCTAAVKAQSDLICTSSNAVDLVNQLPADQPVLFAPDQNLGRWVQQQSGRELTSGRGAALCMRPSVKKLCLPSSTNIHG